MQTLDLLHNFIPVNRKKLSARRPQPAPLRYASPRTLTFQSRCLNITAAKWTYGCGVYSLNQIFMRLGMIFKHCSPECTVASGSARRLARSGDKLPLTPPTPTPPLDDKPVDESV